MKRITRHSLAWPILSVIGLTLCLAACSSNKKSDDEDDSKVQAQTPVTVTTADQKSMADYIDLNATSAFLQKNYIKSNANGYIVKVNVQQGQAVSEGQTLFVIKTKEAQTIGNSINVLD